MGVSFSDIAQLALSEPDPIDWDKYQDSQERPAPVDDGVYNVQAPEEILFDSWTDKNTNRSYLIIDSKATKALAVSDGPFKGRKLFYPFVSSRKYRNTMGSQMGDYIRSFGIAAQPQTPAELAQLAGATANRIGKVQTKQEAYCKACGETVAEGQSACQALSKCPNCGGAVSVSAKIDRWISTVQR